MTTAIAPAAQLDWWSTIDALDAPDDNDPVEVIGSAVADILRQLADLIDNPRELSVIARNEIVRKAIAAAETVESWTDDHDCECEEPHCNDSSCECRPDCDDTQDHVDTCPYCEDRFRCKERHCDDGDCNHDDCDTDCDREHCDDPFGCSCADTKECERCS